MTQPLPPAWYLMLYCESFSVGITDCPNVPVLKLIFCWILPVPTQQVIKLTQQELYALSKSGQLQLRCYSL